MKFHVLSYVCYKCPVSDINAINLVSPADDSKTLIFSFLFIVFTSVSAQKDKQVLDAVYIEKSVSKISETLLVGKFEVSNWLYNQFLSDLSKNRKKEDLKIASVDSTNWLKPPVYIAPFAKFYHRDKNTMIFLW